MPSYNEVLEEVITLIAEAANMDEERVKPTSRLQGDLGLESIDFLDIVFRLERQFVIKIPRNELFPESIFQGDPDYVSLGKLTQKGLQYLREKMPFADISEFEKNPTLDAVSNLFTVEMMAKYVYSKFNTKFVSQ